MREETDKSMESAKKRVIGSIILQVEKSSVIVGIYQSLSKGVISPTKPLVG